jgi:hypothetical protein
MNDLIDNLKRMGRWLDAESVRLFHEVALRGHILRSEFDDEVLIERFGMDYWTVTPFDENGQPCGESLAMAYFAFDDGDIEGWLKRTPVIYTEADIPARIKSMDVYGRTSDEEREADKARREREMREYEYELMLCQADGTMH